MKAADLREMKLEELLSREHELYQEIFDLRNKLKQEAGAKLKEFRSMRKELALVKTVIHEKRVTR